MSIVPISIFITAVFYFFFPFGWNTRLAKKTTRQFEREERSEQRNQATRSNDEAEALNAKETERKKATLTNHGHFFPFSLSLSLFRLYKNSLTKISFGGDCFAEQQHGNPLGTCSRFLILEILLPSSSDVARDLAPIIL